jgi:F-type H+-transporting ATPase subunit b
MKRISIATLSVPVLLATSAVFAADPHAATGAGVDAHAPAASPTLFAGTLAQSIAAIVVFVVVFVVLKQKAWGPILKGLADRDAKIARDLQDAEAARAAAEARLKELDARIAGADAQVRDTLAKATTDAERVATSIRMQAQQEAEEIKERAMRDIDTARKDAVREVYEQTAILATSVAEKILRRNLNAADQRDLVATSLDQLQDVAKN